MGQVADDIIDGLLCQECMMVMPDHQSPGYPRTCGGCRREATAQQPSRHILKTKCPTCGKKFKGISDHLRDAHGVSHGK